MDNSVLWSEEVNFDMRLMNHIKETNAKKERGVIKNFMSLTAVNSLSEWLISLVTIEFSIIQYFRIILCSQSSPSIFNNKISRTEISEVY